MLDETAAEGREHIVSWLPNGMAFRIHRREEFSETILPRYFSTTKIRSFLRQLNIYSFVRVDDVYSDAYGAYWHKLFARGNPTICLGMERTKNKNEKRCKKKADIPSTDKVYPVDDIREEVNTAGQTTMLASAFLVLPSGRNGVREEHQQLPACKSHPIRDARFAVSKVALLPSPDEHKKEGHRTNSLLIVDPTSITTSSECRLEDDDEYNPFDDSGWNYYYPELLRPPETTDERIRPGGVDEGSSGGALFNDHMLFQTIPVAIMRI
jgi:hypothetical protein